MWWVFLLVAFINESFLTAKTQEHVFLIPYVCHGKIPTLKNLL